MGSAQAIQIMMEKYSNARSMVMINVLHVFNAKTDGSNQMDLHPVDFLSKIVKNMINKKNVFYAKTLSLSHMMH